MSQDMSCNAPYGPLLIPRNINGICFAPLPAAVTAKTVVQDVFREISTGTGGDFHMLFLWPDRAKVGNGGRKYFRYFSAAQSEILRMNPGRKRPDSDARHGFNII